MPNSGFVDAEYVDGIFNDEQVRFKRVWSGHRFTDEEVDDLLGGHRIVITAKSQRTGNDFMVEGELAHQTFTAADGTEREYVGFKPDFDAPPFSWAQHEFTKTERRMLADGQLVHITDAVSRKGNTFECDVAYDDEEQTGRKHIRPIFDN